MSWWPCCTSDLNVSSWKDTQTQSACYWFFPPPPSHRVQNKKTSRNGGSYKKVPKWGSLECKSIISVIKIRSHVSISTHHFPFLIFWSTAFLLSALDFSWNTGNISPVPSSSQKHKNKFKLGDLKSCWLMHEVALFGVRLLLHWA